MNEQKIAELQEQLNFYEKVINSSDEEIIANHIASGADIPPSSVRSSARKERSRLKGKIAVLKGEKPKPGTKQLKIKLRTWNRPGRVSTAIEVLYTDPDTCEKDCDELVRFAMSLFSTRNVPGNEREAARAEWLQKYDERYAAAMSEG